MERIDPEGSTTTLLGEHNHRYEWASSLAYGDVCDIACGMGYGSTIVASSRNVTSYVGIDIDAASIQYAAESYGRTNVAFSIGDCTNIPMSDGKFDTIISLETLEHLQAPELALAEYRRVLKPGGILIGSVPSREYEKLCTLVYGPNPYHFQEFDEIAIDLLLKRYFPSIHLFHSSLNVTSLIEPLHDSGSIRCAELTVGENQTFGSILFVASSRSDLDDYIANRLDVGKSLVRCLSGLVLYDWDYVIPKVKTISDLEQMVRDRDELIAAQDAIVTDYANTIRDQDRLVDERDDLIHKLERAVQEHEKTIADQAKLVDERDVLIGRMESMMAERDQTIADQAKLVDERDALIGRMESMMAERDRTIADQAGLVDERDHVILAQDALLKEREREIKDLGERMARHVESEGVRKRRRH